MRKLPRSAGSQLALAADLRSALPRSNLPRSVAGAGSKGSHLQMKLPGDRVIAGPTPHPVTT
jgi:hypothetical protein